MIIPVHYTERFGRFGSFVFRSVHQVMYCMKDVNVLLIAIASISTIVAYIFMIQHPFLHYSVPRMEVQNVLLPLIIIML